MDTIACIFARGGSKGLPNKNILEFCGKPLIAWSIELLTKIPRVRRIIVSTDSKQIAEVALAFGAEVPFIRPDYLAKDDSPEWLAWQHALKEILKEEGALPEALLSLPTTSPLRELADVNWCLECFDKRLCRCRNNSLSFPQKSIF